jgi:choline dehydrogenase-like flavoprotein
MTPAGRAPWNAVSTTWARRACTWTRAGVVDPDCRVHGVANLYVAGSSVFPTSGYANPTFTIVALALRLADHLKTMRLS